MSKVDRVVMTVVALFSLCCLVASATAQNVKLVFAQRNTTEVGAGQAWLRATEQYQKENPHIEFEFIGDQDGTRFLEKIAVRGATLGFPDVLHLLNLWMYDFTEQGLLEPVPADLLRRLKNNMYPQSLQYLEYKGQQYGIPTESQVTGLLYNRQLLAQAGVSDIPGTWEDLMALSKRLVGSQGPEGELGGVAVNGGGWGWSANWHMLSKAYGGSYTAADSTVNLDTDVNRELLQRIVEWFSVGGPANLNRDGFCRGEVYFGIAFPFWSTWMTANFPEQWSSVFSAAKIPSGPQATAGYQYGWGLAVSSTSRNRAEAWKFVEWLATQPMENGLTSIGDFQLVLGSLPTHRRDLQSSAFASMAGFYDGFINNLPYTVSEPKMPQGDARQNILGREIGDAIAGRKTPQQALVDATTSINALFKK